MTSLAHKKVDAIIQARMGSTRLPEKILAPVGGRALLLRVVDRLRECPLVDRIIVATTTASSDDAVEEFCASENLLCCRGDLQNVLARFIGACEDFGCERILRVCADNPFLDPELMTAQIEAFGPDVDYCTYVTGAGEPLILKPVGICVEAVTRQALEAVQRMADDPTYCEHVTMYIYRHPEKFRIASVNLPEYVDPERRLTVDYPEDVGFCNQLLAAAPDGRARTLMRVLDETPELAEAMKAFSTAHVKVYKLSGNH